MKNFLVFVTSVFLGASIAFTLEANSIMRILYSSQNANDFFLSIIAWVSLGFILAYFGQRMIFFFQSERKKSLNHFFIFIFVFFLGSSVCFLIEAETVSVLFAEKVGRLSYILRIFVWSLYGMTLYHFGSQVRLPKLFFKKKTHFLKRAL
jgi:hypothetical protein